MAQITVQGKKVNVSDNFFQLSPEDQDATVDEIAAGLGAGPASTSSAGEDDIPDRSWSEIGGNIGPDAVNTVKGMWEFIKHPEPAIEALQGGVDRVLSEGATNFLDSLSPRTPERKEYQRELSAEAGKQLKHDYGGLKNIKNTIITRPVGSALDIAGLAAGGAGLVAKGRSVAAPVARIAESPAVALDVGRPAVRKLDAAIRADAVTPEQITALGPEGMLMDAGPNLRKQGRGVFLLQGEGSQIINQALKDREAGTTQRALQAADDALGPRVNAIDQRQRLKDAREGNGSPLYNAAFNDAKMVDTTPVIGAIDDIVQPNVAGMGPESMSPLGKRLVSIRNRLTLNKGQVTEGRALQHIYQEIGDNIGEAVRSGRGNEARTLIEIKKKLEASIDAATDGGFSKANKQWATDSEIMDAFGFGEDLARNSMTPDEVMARLKTMKPEARPQVLLGLRNWVYEVVGTARNNAAAARSLLERGWTQEKLGMVLGQGKAKQLADRIGLERTYAETNQRVRLNSNTAEGITGAMDVADSSLLGQGNAAALTYGGIKGLATKKALDVVDAVATKLAGHRGNVTRADLAKMLTATGAQRDEIVRLLQSPEAMRAFKAGGVAGLAPRFVSGLLRGLVAERTLEKVDPARR